MRRRDGRQVGAISRGKGGGFARSLDPARPSPPNYLSSTLPWFAAQFARRSPASVHGPPALERAAARVPALEPLAAARVPALEPLAAAVEVGRAVAGAAGPPDDLVPAAPALVDAVRLVPVVRQLDSDQPCTVENA